METSQAKINSASFAVILRTELERARAKNKSYSLRSFAKKLSVSPSALSELLSGKRNASPKLATRLAQKLALDPKTFQSLFPTQKNSTKKIGKPSVTLLMDHFQMVSDWSHFAILSLIETDDFSSDIEWIAQRLNLTVNFTRQAVERLIRLGMIEVHDGKMNTTGLSFRTPDEVSNLALKKAHEMNLEIAERSLYQDDISDRDFTAVTMAIDPNLLPEAKKRIRKFERELCNFLESGNKTEVFKINVQLFPLSKRI